MDDKEKLALKMDWLSLNGDDRWKEEVRMCLQERDMALALLAQFMPVEVAHVETPSRGQMWHDKYAKSAITVKLPIGQIAFSVLPEEEAFASVQSLRKASAPIACVDTVSRANLIHKWLGKRRGHEPDYVPYAGNNL